MTSYIIQQVRLAWSFVPPRCLDNESDRLSFGFWSIVNYFVIIAYWIDGPLEQLAQAFVPVITTIEYKTDVLFQIINNGVFSIFTISHINSS
jgi:hypothetical protein